MEKPGSFDHPNVIAAFYGAVSGASFGLAALSLNAAVGLDLPGFLDMPDDLNKSTLLVLLAPALLGAIAGLVAILIHPAEPPRFHQ